ncbi:helicase, partial [Enterococcus faecium]|nr:helicase [Enterococcus faecium]
PFTKKYLYFEDSVIEMTRNFEKKMKSSSLTLYVSGNVKTPFSVLLLRSIPNIHTLNTGQGFLQHDYSEDNLFNSTSNINDNFISIIELEEDDIFYYVYGILHSEDYRDKYANDLQKALPRIPEVKDKEKYVEIGRKLADLHLNYEDVPAYDGVNIVFKSDNPSFKVKKMKHPRRGQLDTIIFNEDIVITDIPERAYEYVVNGKPAIEWIIDQYQVKKDKKSGIVDDPNEFSDNPKYIFNLLLSIINVSMQTMDLVDSLPPLEIID